MQDLVELSVFLAAAELRSFSRAAEHLGSSPSAVGKAIVRLEHRLDAALFHRTTRCIRLTPAGELLYVRARRIREEWSEFREALSQERQSPRGQLRVAMPALGHRLIAPHLADLRQAHPEIDLDLDQDDETRDLVEHGVDLAIRGGPLDDSTYLSRKLCAYTFGFYASPSYLRGRAEPENPAMLVRHDLVCFRFPRGDGLQPWWIDGTAKVPEGRLRVVSSSMEGVLTAVLAGSGIAQMPDFLARDGLANGLLTEVLMGRGRQGEFWFVWPPSHRHSVAVRAMMDFLSSRILQ